MRASAEKRRLAWDGIESASPLDNNECTEICTEIWVGTLPSLPGRRT